MSSRATLHAEDGTSTASSVTPVQFRLRKTGPTHLQEDASRPYDSERGGRGLQPNHYRTNKEKRERRFRGDHGEDVLLLEDVQKPEALQLRDAARLQRGNCGEGALRRDFVEDVRKDRGGDELQLKERSRR